MQLAMDSPIGKGSQKCHPSQASSSQVESEMLKEALRLTLQNTGVLHSVFDITTVAILVDKEKTKSELSH